MGIINAAAMSLFFIIIAIAILILVLMVVYAGRILLDDSNEKERWENMRAELHDANIIKEAKNHTLNYPEDFVKTLKKEKGDFDVDFNIEFKKSTLKTETVYAE